MLFGNLLQDLRYALRQLRQSPGFTLTAVIVLALGLGANIAVFTVLNGILLRPLPYAQPDRIVAVGFVCTTCSYSMNYANMLQLRDAVGGRIQMGVSFGSVDASIIGPGGRIQVKRDEVDSGLLPMLGVQPMLGRVFRPEENEPGRNHVVLLGEDVWRKLYNSDPQHPGSHAATLFVPVRGTHADLVPGSDSAGEPLGNGYRLGNSRRRFCPLAGRHDASPTNGSAQSRPGPHRQRSPSELHLAHASESQRLSADVERRSA
jgi:hypothetical protein